MAVFATVFFFCNILPAWLVAADGCWSFSDAMIRLTLAILMPSIVFRLFPPSLLPSGMRFLNVSGLKIAVYV